MIDHYIGSFVCALAFVVEILALWNVMRGYASRDWKPIKGRILSSSIAVIQSSNEGGQTVTYQPKIKYAYEYEGKEYTSKKVGYLLAQGGQKSAQKLTGKFSEGKNVDVFIDPSKPSRSVLIRGIPAFGAVVAIGIPFFLYFIGMLLNQK